MRSSNDQATWSSWETASNGVALSSTPDGRYLRIETTLQITSGDVSPILYDLTVEAVGPGNQPPVADAGPDIWTNDPSASVTLDGSGSTDDGLIQPLTYTWVWSDGSATGVNPTVTLPQGITTVTLTVFDGEFSDDDTVEIIINPPAAPVPAISPIGIIALIGVLGFIGAGVISRRW